jgi:transposase-like protein
MRPATWTEERLIHIDRQLHAGASIDDIAEHYGVSHHTIRSARKRGLAQGIGTPVPRSNMVGTETAAGTTPRQFDRPGSGQRARHGGA